MCKCGWFQNMFVSFCFYAMDDLRSDACGSFPGQSIHNLQQTRSNQVIKYLYRQFQTSEGRIAPFFCVLITWPDLSSWNLKVIMASRETLASCVQVFFVFTVFITWLLLQLAICRTGPLKTCNSRVQTEDMNTGGKKICYTRQTSFSVAPLIRIIDLRGSVRYVGPHDMSRSVVLNLWLIDHMWSLELYQVARCRVISLISNPVY